MSISIFLVSLNLTQVIHDPKLVLTKHQKTCNRSSLHDLDSPSQRVKLIRTLRHRERDHTLSCCSSYEQCCQCMERGKKIRSNFSMQCALSHRCAIGSIRPVQFTKTNRSGWSFSALATNFNKLPHWRPGWLMSNQNTLPGLHYICIKKMWNPNSWFYNLLKINHRAHNGIWFNRFELKESLWFWLHVN